MPRGRPKKQYLITRHAMMLGRLSNGFQSDHGALVHALHKTTVPSPRIPEITITIEKSICGRRPGRRSVGWSTNDNDLPVTCPNCLKRMGA